MNFTVSLVLTGLCAIAPSDDGSSVGIYLVDADLGNSSSQYVCGYKMDMEHYPYLLLEMQNFEQYIDEQGYLHEECEICSDVFTNLEGDVIGRIPLGGYEISFPPPKRVQKPELGSRPGDTVKPEEKQKNKRSFVWVARLNEMENGGGLEKLNDDCTKTTPGMKCNIAARAVFNSGSILSGRLGRDKNKKLAVWEFTSYEKRKKGDQGLADRVEIDLGEYEGESFEVALKRWKDDKVITLKLKSTRDGDPIRIGLSNLPLASKARPTTGAPLGHFAWFYTLSAAYDGDPSRLEGCPIPKKIKGFNDFPSVGGEFCPLTRF